MDTKIYHDFAWQHNAALVNMLDKTVKLPQFLNKLRKYAATQRDPNTPQDAIDSNQLKIIGDGFECFGEAFIKLCGTFDNRLYIKDFKRLDINDNGVDGEGVDSKTGQRIFVQFKCYKSTEFLTGVKSHLDSFVAESLMLMLDSCQKPAEVKEWPRLIVITSAADIHPYTKEQKYRNRVECFPHDELNRLTSNESFWAEFLRLVTI
jgi:hypothetical protein